jgi:hypothetical protein
MCRKVSSGYHVLVAGGPPCHFGTFLHIKSFVSRTYASFSHHQNTGICAIAGPSPPFYPNTQVTAPTLAEPNYAAATLH